MRIADLYQRGAPVVSFEFFPPKTDAGFRSLFRTIEELGHLSPGFVSVTMGAGGSTRKKTIELVARIERETGLTAMAHLPCMGFERAGISDVLDQLEGAGIENVLALGGDPPANAKDFVQPLDGFVHASELVEFIRSRWDFSIGGACYPEVHPRAESAEADLAHLGLKVGAGANFLITQLFFDNTHYFDFVSRARAAGIDLPIVPGIMPITSVSGVRRMLGLCGASLPTELETELARVDHDEKATAELGVRWATEQCRELLERGAPGIHFYTLNRSPSSREIYDNVIGSAS